MIIGVDVETDRIEKEVSSQELRFIVGCIYTETGKPYFFYNPEEMWSKILEIGYKLNKRHKNLVVYAHNHDFDFQEYANKTDSNIEYLKIDKLIANYKFPEIKNKTKIQFLDTMLIHNRSLESMGKFIGIPKMEWDFSSKDAQKMIDKIKEDIDNDNYNSEILERFKQYNLNDAIIVVEFIKKFKKYLKDDGINVRKLVTIGLIAKNYFAKKLREDSPKIFESPNRARFLQLPNNEKEFIHLAYRAGRNEVYNFGEFEGVTEVDLNSSYPYSLINIEIPKLESRVYIRKPLEIMKKKELFSKIGVSKVIIRIGKDKNIGLLPVRSNGVQYPSKKGRIIVGNYTHLEINKAMKEGYKVLEVLESIVFNEKFEVNPFRKIILDMFEKRKKDEFANYMYKNIMNNFVGKLAQRNKKRIIKFESEANKMKLLKEGFKIIGDVDGDNKYIFEKKSDKYQYSGFYNPIIAAYVNANSRLLLYDVMKKIDSKDLLTCNTDSVVFRNFKKYKKLFKFGNELGEWKIKHMNENSKIYSKNQYCVKDDIRVSGVHTKGLNLGIFKQGKLEFVNKEGIIENSSKGLKFKRIVRDLNESMEKEIDKQEKMLMKSIYIDDRLTPEENEILLKTIGL